ncbi:Zinc finger C2H2-type protein [Neofusicoccum parvum]|uniref:Zinc finger C2H2-type protein n=2 Tax=Neofusicoccum parvum TaxID=310453 RepID=A0ACB5RYF9_9PEZI|nr:putative c2h2 transcription factor protein [Neofusicoccum parvum UCRNP2]GME25497.1 Zinc finger C2H2-type protein [Neofusicoccum parvum]GME60006.1 Zinc finger C2H2-type protein [Neofusicoccum parvum]
MDDTPSPTTPDFFDDEGQPTNVPAMPYFIGMPQQHQMKPEQQQHMMPAYPAMMPQQQYSHPQSHQVFVRAPGMERQQMPPAQPKSKKNQYPCPLAMQFNCKDFFTTSGHAARHAKKHTGKKDAVCPDCRKAFTRKDNMEQHRRTHQNGRNARNASKENDDGRVKKAKTTSRPKPSPLQAAQIHSQLAMVDPSLPVSPASSYGGAVQPVHEYITSPFSDHNMSYPPPEHYQLNPATPSSTYGLETLALACGEKRRSDA